MEETLRHPMMAPLSASNLLISLSPSKRFHLGYLCYTGLRHYAKKYTYNLDYLIEWKKETALVFGSPRKPTKTGKLKKCKTDEKLQDVLEALSAQSNHSSSFKTGQYDEHLDDLNIRVKSCDKSYASQASSQAEDFFVDLVPLQDDEKDALANVTPAEMINKHPSSKKPSNKLQNIQSSDDHPSFISFEETNDYSKHSLPVPSEKKRNVGDDDIYIPVISPIPSGGDLPKTYNDIAAGRSRISQPPLKPPFPSKKLPLEPPGSFGFINEVPLNYDNHLDGREFDDRITKFKADVELLSLRKVPSVKSILNKTMPDLNRFFLNRWREGMIKELGEQGFKAHQEATIKRGVNFHANVLELLSGKRESDIQIMPDNEGHWASLQTAMRFISGVEALEEDMQHPALLYRGVMDCMAKYKDLLCVIDWKTSKKPRPLLKNTYDDPVQVAAYMGLANANKQSLKMIGEVNHGLLVVIYPDGSPAHLHLMNKALCEQYWQDWLGRLYQHYQLLHTDKFGSN